MSDSHQPSAPPFPPSDRMLGPWDIARPPPPPDPVVAIAEAVTTAEFDLSAALNEFRLIPFGDSEALDKAITVVTKANKKLQLLQQAQALLHQASSL